MKNIPPIRRRKMNRRALGRLLLSCLLVIGVAVGQAAAEEAKPVKKLSHNGGKVTSADQKESGDSASSTAKATADAKKADEKKTDEKKADAKAASKETKGDEKKPAA